LDISALYYVISQIYTFCKYVINIIGIVVLQKAESRQEKDTSLNFHKLMQSITFLSVIGGFYVIYTFKNMSDKEHCKFYQILAFIFKVIDLTIYKKNNSCIPLWKI